MAAIRHSVNGAVSTPQPGDRVISFSRGAPPPVLAPKGLAGILEGRTPGYTEPLDTSKFTEREVYVNVYDVGDNELLQRINRATTGNNSVLIGGVFHAGIQIYGTEYGYGSTEEDRTGLGACIPRTHPQHTYRATVPMGETNLTKEEVHALVARLALEWRGPAYNLIHNNCLSFCNALLKEIGLGRLPGWIDRASRTASRLDKAVQFVRSVSAEELQEQAQEALEKLKRDSNQAFEGLSLQAQASPDSRSAGGQFPLAPEVERAQASAVELGQKAQEQMQAIGLSLGKWVEDMRTPTNASSETATTQAFGEALEDIKGTAQKNVQAFFQWLPEDIQKGIPWAAADEECSGNGSTATSSRRVARGRNPRQGDGQGSSTSLGSGAGGADSHESEDDDEEQARAINGLIRSREERMMNKGLLDDSDEEALCETSFSPLPRVSGAAATQPPAKVPITNSAVPDLLSGDEPAQSLGPRAATTPASVASVDLLTGETLEPSFASPAEPRPATAIASDPLDLLS